MANVLITGSNRGVGLQLATQYAARGDHVYAGCRDPESADELNAVSGDVTVVKLVPTDTASIAEAAAGIESLDILINNAGQAGPAPDQQSALSMDFDGWAETFDVNTMAPLKVLQGFHGALKNGSNAKAVTITSQMGALDLNWPVMYAYCSTKAAVNKVMRMISLDLAKDGIAVSLIHPGHVRTDMGGPNGEIEADESAAGIISVIDQVSLETTGEFQKWNGEAHAW